MQKEVQQILAEEEAAVKRVAEARQKAEGVISGAMGRSREILDEARREAAREARERIAAVTRELDEEKKATLSAFRAELRALRREKKPAVREAVLAVCRILFGGGAA